MLNGDESGTSLNSTYLKLYSTRFKRQVIKGVGTLRAKIGPISEMKQTLNDESTRFSECKSV